MAVNPIYSYKHLTSGTTTISSKQVVLAAVVINKALTGTVTITDGAATVAVLTNGTTAPLGSVIFSGGTGGISLQGLVVALSGTEDITVIFE